MKDVPITPCLIICGETEYTGTAFYLCIDKIVVCEEIDSFELALSILFGAFYCLNIQYPHAAAATLELIQRCFANINPTSGTKVNKDVKKKHQIYNNKVVSLLKGLSEFEWIGN